ncbi:cytochrome P450 [Colletotrichum paranaense]|uniref:Cytochrome P450 n=1 Tax=Colletotrichum paranaense TaxID=1914294 RepID=A0ABQ9T7D7_9PEZI|nr:cytochrome P450 [Colletotrichum paranaense]KAK1547697.1 cytochrome P450 [Colletotrichum paranaense]
MADMLDITNPIQWLTVLAPFTAVLPILYILYQIILPKPIPGIPYNKHAAKSIFGDIPDIKREPPGNLLIWIAAQSRRHNSPMFQVWLGPLTMVGQLVKL